MKRTLLSTCIFICVFSLSISACGGAPAPAVPSDEEPPLVETSTVAATLSPTEAPPPIPCTITFDSDRDGNWEIYAMGPDGNDQVNLTNDQGDDSDPAWSPDGSHIAFVSNRVNESGGGQRIYVMNADGSDVRQLNPQGDSKWPDWSHDGSRITYTDQADIYVINADGSGQPLNLTNSPEEDQQSTWSPDGSQIAWLSGSGGNWNIFLMNADGGNIQQLTEDGMVSDIQWTVDGQIFTHWKNNEASCFNCVMDSDGTNIKDAGGKGEVQRFLPFWTEAGDRVECISGSLNDTDEEIYLVSDIYPDIFLNLTNDPGNDRNPDWPANCGPGPDAAIGDGEVEIEQPKNPDQIVIGYGDFGNNMSEQREADLLKACSELQIECVESDSISQLVERNVDAIISFSNKFDALGSFPVFQDVVSKGIVLLVLNAETVAAGAYNLSIDSDAVKSSLEWMFKEMGGDGEFVFYNFGQNNFHQDLIDQELKQNPGIKATSMPAEYDGTSLTQESIAALASSNPNLEAIWTDEWPDDVFWGLKDSQVTDLPAIRCEPRPEMLQWWKGRTEENPTFSCQSIIKPGGTGYEGVYVAYYLLTGEQIDSAALGGEFGNTLIYHYPVITNDNLDEWLGKMDTMRKGERDVLEIPPMTPEQIKAEWFLE